jgi:hypothetical protein
VVKNIHFSCLQAVWLCGGVVAREVARRNPLPLKNGASGWDYTAKTGNLRSRSVSVFCVSFGLPVFAVLQTPAAGELSDTSPGRILSSDGGELMNQNQPGASDYLC